MTSMKTCQDCTKATGSIHCTGCDKHYCFKCFIEHRKEFVQELEIIINERDIIREQFDRASESKYDSNHLMIKMNEWEQHMLEKVKQVANERRTQISELIDKNESNIKIKLKSFSDDLVTLRGSENYTETDIERMRVRLQVLRDEIEDFPQFRWNTTLTDNSDQIHWSEIISLNLVNEIMPNILNIPSNAQWSTLGTKVVQNLKNPEGLSIDPVNGNIFIADTGNKRIVIWNKASNKIKIFLGGLSEPGVVLVDKSRDSLLISDRGSRRLIRCSLSNAQRNIEVVVENIKCNGLALDGRGAIFVVDMENHSVRKFEDGDKDGVIVAGGNGRGNKLNQLNRPNYITIDQEQSVYISDAGNGRIMKWKKGDSIGQELVNGLNHTNGILLDTNGAIYISELSNCRVTRWQQNENKKEILLGQKQSNKQSNTFQGPDGIAFDNDYNLYVVDLLENCVQLFSRVK